jgi:hypothetical protein
MIFTIEVIHKDNKTYEQNLGFLEFEHDILNAG